MNHSSYRRLATKSALAFVQIDLGTSSVERFFVFFFLFSFLKQGKDCFGLWHSCTYSGFRLDFVTLFLENEIICMLKLRTVHSPRSTRRR